MAREVAPSAASSSPSSATGAGEPGSSRWMGKGGFLEEGEGGFLEGSELHALVDNLVDVTDDLMAAVLEQSAPASSLPMAQAPAMPDAAAGGAEGDVVASLAMDFADLDGPVAVAHEIQ